MEISSTTHYYGLAISIRACVLVVNDYQHRRANIELLEKLGDEEMRRDEVVLVLLLHFPDDVGHPFEVTLRLRHPEKVNLQHIEFFNCILTKCQPATVVSKKTF